MVRKSLLLATALLTASSVFAQQAPATKPATAAAPVAASAPAPVKIGSLTLTGSVRVRTEVWDWFEGEANNSYAFTHSLVRLGIGQQLSKLDWQVELSAPFLLGAPNDAVAPGAQGALGLGANYYSANDRSRFAASVFPKQAFLKLKGFGTESGSLKFGRFEFVEGTEVAPKDASLAAVKRDRVSNRLIGNFAFSAYQRSMDGLQYSVGTKNNFTAVAFRPTRGVFQVDGLGELDINVVYGAYTRGFAGKKTNAELRVFGAGYQDVRNVVKTDNRAAAVRNLDREHVNIGTVGAHYIEVVNTSKGKFDVVLWTAGQFGSWGTQDHRAISTVTELGWQPNVKAWKPWLRAGYTFGSGDGNAADGKHTTFFQMLPTPRLYARMPFYNMMNVQDAYAMLSVKPTSKLSLRTDIHAIRLANANDVWYQGGGAFQPRTFGYTGRASGGNSGLGNMWDISADYAFNPHVSMTTYFANTWGKGVMDSVYPKRPNGRFGYVEMNYKF